MNLKLLFSKIQYRYFNRSLVNRGERCFLHYGGTFITNRIKGVDLEGINIGDDAYIGRHFNLHTGSSIAIGKNTVLSDYVYISTLSHGFKPGEIRIMEQECVDKGKVIIGDNSFIGFGAIILPGVELGHWCIVGSGSVVTKSFPDYSMIAGNPAKTIKKYCHKDKMWKEI